MFTRLSHESQVAVDDGDVHHCRLAIYSAISANCEVALSINPVVQRLCDWIGLLACLQAKLRQVALVTGASRAMRLFAHIETQCRVIGEIID